MIYSTPYFYFHYKYYSLAVSSPPKKTLIENAVQHSILEYNLLNNCDVTFWNWKDVILDDRKSEAAVC